MRTTKKSEGTNPTSPRPRRKIGFFWGTGTGKYRGVWER